MRLKLIVCEVFKRECELLSPRFGDASQQVYMPFGLHGTPETLRKKLQEEIDLTPAGSFEAIVLLYGLCSNALAGLRARTMPLVIPRAHDCIALLLGSKERYAREFRRQPGTYWYSCGWIENKLAGNGETPGESGIQSLQKAEANRRYQQYAARFGEDNARYLMEQEAQWRQHYSRLVYIHRDVGRSDFYRGYTQSLAKKEGWKFEEMAGEDRLLQQLLHGEWPQEDFVVIGPGQQSVATWDDRILSAADVGGGG